MRLVILESPYAGNVDKHREYLSLAILHCLAAGDAPFASHEMYTRALDDALPNERAMGMAAGFAWHKAAEAMVVYADHGISKGMQEAIDSFRGPVEYRSIV